MQDNYVRIVLETRAIFLCRCFLLTFFCFCFFHFTRSFVISTTTMWQYGVHRYGAIHFSHFPSTVLDLWLHRSQASLWYTIVTFPVCVDSGPHPSDRVCHGGSEAGISNCGTEVQNPRSPGCIKGSQSQHFEEKRRGKKILGSQKPINAFYEVI